MSLLKSLFGGSDQKSQSSSYISKEQLPYLTNLWGMGQSLLNNQGPAYWQDQAAGVANPLMQQGNQMLAGLQNNPYMGGQYSPSLAYQGQMAAGQQQIGQTMERAMAAMGQTGVQAGQFGTARHGVGAGLIGEAGINAAGALSGQLMGQDMRNQLGQAGIYAQSQLGGLNSLQGLFGLGTSPLQASLAPLLGQAGIVGSPAILGQQTSSGSQQGGIIPGLGSLFGGIGSFLGG